ncbi:hypothetical protein HZI73_18140 [Vallitalea pronyensis]|uniref:N-acetyltransferase domain-containing protein n=1 Tax=Vallitalea pronyensis TaxID=1348613 RepID=A0A8J8MLS2_9FIRM|nr:hypothetical protein [Vallitalea pronyensis]QUI24095.1 hypothetical protein HZI73_18140 [Vallitalea pronyensis]
MIKIINNNNRREFSDKIIKAEKEFFPMLGYRKMAFHDRILNNHKIDDAGDKQRADFMTKHWQMIDYLDNGDYCLYHLFTTDSTPDVLMTTMIIPSNFERRIEIVEESIKHILQWAKEQGSFQYFKIQVLEYGEIQVYPSLAYYLVPILLRENFQPQYGIYLKTNTKNSIAPFSLKGTYHVKKGKDNPYDAIYEFYKKTTFNAYFLADSMAEMDEIKDKAIFYDSLMTVRNNQDDIIGAIYADMDEEGKIWLDNLAIKDDYVNEEIGRFLIHDILGLLKRQYADRDIYVYTYRAYRKSIMDYESCDFEGFEYWVDLLYSFKE